MLTVIFKNEENLFHSVSGYGLTVRQHKGCYTKTENIEITPAKAKTIFSPAKEAVTEERKTKGPHITFPDSLEIDTPGQGYEGTGVTYRIPNITFDQYAEQLTTAAASSFPIIDLRPIQEANVKESAKETLG